MDYNTYLQSTHWKSTREEKLKSHPVCRICKSDNHLNIHHKFYTFRSGGSILYHEQQGNLITLCSSCHRLWHKYCYGKFDSKGQPNISKKIMFIREMINGGAKKSWAFRLVGMGVMDAGIYKVRKFYKKN